MSGSFRPRHVSCNRPQEQDCTEKEHCIAATDAAYWVCLGSNIPWPSCRSMPPGQHPQRYCPWEPGLVVGWMEKSARSSGSQPPPLLTGPADLYQITDISSHNAAMLL